MMARSMIFFPQEERKGKDYLINIKYRNFDPNGNAGGDDLIIESFEGPSQASGKTRGRKPT
jgi:hypothetical protein